MANQILKKKVNIFTSAQLGVMTFMKDRFSTARETVSSLEFIHVFAVEAREIATHTKGT